MWGKSYYEWKFRMFDLSPLKGCPWNENVVTIEASMYGHIECLKFHHENGYVLKWMS